MDNPVHKTCINCNHSMRFVGATTQWCQKCGTVVLLSIGCTYKPDLAMVAPSLFEACTTALAESDFYSRGTVKMLADAVENYREIDV